MDRRACVEVPALPLQLLLASHPEWRSLPAAVVDADEPTGTLQWVNAAAWRARLRPGLRYAAALSLEANLRAGVVASATIDTAVRDLTETLRRHTPHVEPSREEPGVFWLDASGLESLYTSVETWTRAVERSVRAGGYAVHLASGFTRFGTYALARALADGSRPRPAPKPRPSATTGGVAGHARVLVCQSEEEERRLAGDVRLERLGIDPKLRDALKRLGVHTVADFLRLPAQGIHRRFGEAASHLHRRARGEAWDPLLAVAAEPSRKRALLLDHPVLDMGIVLFVIRRLLVELLGDLAAQGQAVRGVVVSLHSSLRREVPSQTLSVTTAEPTLSEAVLVDLLRLRLETQRPARQASIVEIEVEVQVIAADQEQLRLFRERTRRDLAAGTRAIARVRAEFGQGCVVRAVLRQGHLPEASHTWEPIDQVTAPSPRSVRIRPLVRRMYEQATALPPKPFRERDDCWLAVAPSDVDPSFVIPSNSAHPVPPPAGGRSTVRDQAPATHRSAHARVDHMVGPYVVSGGWWNREVHREYHYARTEDGEILWVYYDRRRRRWFLAGKVE